MPESKGRINHYEGFFLVSQSAAQDLSSCVEHITEIIKRGNGELLAFKKWDERRLAYEIQKHKRGVYFLAYFSADPVTLGDIERLANLSETILRFMITRADHMTVDQMRATDEMAKLADEAKLRGSDDDDDNDDRGGNSGGDDQGDENEPSDAEAETAGANEG